jgi:ribonuclease HI
MIQNLLQWNSRSLLPKKDELLQTLRYNNIEIASIAETWLNPYYYVKIPDYHTLRDDRLDGKGGAALLIHTSIPFSEINIKSPDCPFDIVAAKVYNTVYASIYISPNCHPSREHLQGLLTGLGENCIIMGDFNAHHPIWGSNSANRMGRMIIDLLSEHNLCLLNNGNSTRINLPNQNPSMVDLTICSPQHATVLQWEVLSGDTLGSDHYPILVSTPHAHGLRPFKGGSCGSFKRTKYNTSRADWGKFSNLIEDGIVGLPSPAQDNIKVCYTSFVDILKDKANKSIPSVAKNRKKPSPPPWWDQACEEAVSNRKTCILAYRTYSTFENFLLLKNAQASAKRILKNKKRNGWKRFCNSLSPETPLSQVWESVRRFKKSFTPYTRLPSNEAWIHEFANGLAPLTVPSREDIPRPYSLQSSSWMDIHFSLAELKSVLPHLRDTTPGMDDIPYSFLTHISEESLGYFLRMVNVIFESGEVPEEWRTQLIIPALKPKKDPNEGSSYRPIALSSTLAKVTEHLIKNRLEWHLESNKILPPTQFGFRKSKSTAESISILLTDIQIAFTKGEHVVGVCLDINAAFDNVLINVLEDKLLNMEVSPKLSFFITNLLRDRTIYILEPRINELITRKVIKGLPQGSVLSPTLFNVYSHDIDSSLAHSVHSLQYADDLFLYAVGPDIRLLQRVINESLEGLGRWMGRHGLQLSPNKSKCIVFSRLRKPQPIAVMYDQSNIPQVKEIRFLGVTIDQHLAWTSYVTEIANRCQAGLNILRAVSRVWWGSHPSTQKLFYNAYVRSQLDYATFLIEPTSIKNLNVLNKIQYQALRLIIGAMKSSPINALQVESADPPLKLRRQWQADRFISKCSRIEQHPVITKLQELKSIIHYSYWRRKSVPLVLNSLNSLSVHAWGTPSLPVLPIYTFPFESLTFIPNIITTLGVQRGPHALTQFNTVIQTQWYGWRRIYTDGSRLESGTSGSAFCGGDSEGLFAFSSKVSIFTAEAIAVLEAIKHLSSSPGGNYLILSDSLSLLQKLKSPAFSHPSDYICLQIRDLLKNYTETGDEVAIAWIPSHCGIPGNEKVDALARRAASSTHGSTIIDLFPTNDVLISLREVMLQRWQAEWSDPGATKGRRLYEIYPRVTYKPWFHKFRCDKLVVSTLCRMRIGHCCTGSHLFRIGVLQSPYCDCELDFDTLDHVFFGCPINDQYPLFENDLIRHEVSLPCNIVSLLHIWTTEYIIQSTNPFHKS